MSRTGLSDCHLAEIMEDIEDASSPGYGRPMCSFCGKKWPESLSAKEFNNNLELVLRRWKEGETTTQEVQNYINREYSSNFSQTVSKVRPHLQKRKKPLYEYDFNILGWRKV